MRSYQHILGLHARSLSPPFSLSLLHVCEDTQSVQRYPTTTIFLVGSTKGYKYSVFMEKLSKKWVNQEFLIGNYQITEMWNLSKGQIDTEVQTLT